MKVLWVTVAVFALAGFGLVKSKPTNLDLEILRDVVDLESRLLKRQEGRGTEPQGGEAGGVGGDTEDSDEESGDEGSKPPKKGEEGEGEGQHSGDEGSKPPTKDGEGGGKGQDGSGKGSKPPKKDGEGGGEVQDGGDEGSKPPKKDGEGGGKGQDGSGKGSKPPKKDGEGGGEGQDGDDEGSKPPKKDGEGGEVGGEGNPPPSERAAEDVATDEAGTADEYIQDGDPEESQPDGSHAVGAFNEVRVMLNHLFQMVQQTMGMLNGISMKLTGVPLENGQTHANGGQYAGDKTDEHNSGSDKQPPGPLRKGNQGEGQTDDSATGSDIEGNEDESQKTAVSETGRRPGGGGRGGGGGGGGGSRGGNRGGHGGETKTAEDHEEETEKRSKLSEDILNLLRQLDSKR